MQPQLFRLFNIAALLSILFSLVPPVGATASLSRSQTAPLPALDRQIPTPESPHLPQLSSDSLSRALSFLPTSVSPAAGVQTFVPRPGNFSDDPSLPQRRSSETRLGSLSSSRRVPELPGVSPPNPLTHLPAPVQDSVHPSLRLDEAVAETPVVRVLPDESATRLSRSLTPPLAPHPITHTLYLSLISREATPGQPEEAVITPDAGGVLISADGHVTVAFPAGAVSEVTTVRFNHLTPPGIPNYVSPPRFFELTATDEDGDAVTQFQRDFNLTVRYDEASHIAEDRLAAYYFDGNAWQQIASTVDTGSNQVNASLNHFTPFALLAATSINWAVGNTVGLCKGTLIHHGPELASHTTVPEDDWLVKVIGGPRLVNGVLWWDTSRREVDQLPTSGTGWVSQTQAEAACLGNGEDVPPPGEDGLSPLDALVRALLLQMGLSLGQIEDFLAGDPVNPTTGNFVHQSIDLDIPGLAGFDLTLQRTYNSLDERKGLFGYGWSTWLDAELRIANDGSIDVRYPDGHGAYFAVVDGEQYAPGQAGVFDTLSYQTDRFRLTTPAQMHYLFNSSGKLIGLEDRRGNKITLERDGGGKITKIIDSAFREFPVTYEGDYIGSISDPTGRALRYSYQDGNLVGVTNGNGGTHKFGYEAHLLTTLTDPADILYLRNVYNDEGQVVEQFDAAGSRSTFNYDAEGLTLFTDNLGNTTRFNYDDRFRMTSRQDALGQTEQFIYNDDHNLISYTDQRGHTWSYTYDDRDNLTGETDPLGFTINYSYNSTNDLIGLTDQGGPGNSTRTTTFVYDSDGNLRHIEQPDGTEIEATYDPHGLLLTLTDENGHTTTYDYDNQSNLIQTTDPLNQSTQYSYDAVGRLTGLTDANGHTAQFKYDANDNITKITDPKGQAVLFEYDGNDTLTRLTDRRGGVTTYAYDDNLKLIAETDPEGHTTTYIYDLMYNRLSATDPLGHTTLYRYDAIYHLIEIEDALGEITRFDYDPTGNIEQITVALAQVITFSYDPLNRLTGVTDALGGVTSYTYDAVGRLTQETNPRGAVTGYGYDRLDRLTQVTDALNGVWTFTYDPAGNLTGVTDANSHTVTLSYDAANRLSQRRDAEGHTTQFGYDGVGNLAAVTDALGRVTTYAYDANDNLSTITDAMGGVTALAYDEEDNLTALTDANGHTTRFAYDLDGLLTSLTEAGDQVTTYAYDSAHNLISLTNAKGNAWIYDHDELNRRLSETNPLGQTTTYAYDALSRLSRVIDANGIATGYAYDALDRLVAVTQNQQLCLHPGCGGQPAPLRGLLCLAAAAPIESHLHLRPALPPGSLAG